jgi:hypothetical protein
MRIKKKIRISDLKSLPIQTSVVYAKEFSELLHELKEHKICDFKNFGFIEVVKYGTASYNLIACIESTFNEIYSSLRVYYFEGCDFECFKNKTFLQKYKTLCDVLDIKTNKKFHNLNSFRNNSLHFYPVLTQLEAKDLNSLDITTLINAGESAKIIILQIANELNKLEAFTSKDLYSKSIPDYLSVV